MFDDMLHLQIAGQPKEKQIMTKATPNTLVRLLLAALVEPRWSQQALPQRLGQRRRPLR